MIVPVERVARASLRVLASAAVAAGWLACACGGAVVPLPAAAAAVAAARNPSVEVFHWWVSDGEKASIAVIQSYVWSQGLDWHGTAAAGSGTSRYGDVLRQRVAAGRAPTAAQMIGYDIHQWASQGKLVILDDVARAQEWDEVVPHGIQRFSKYQGHWVAVPITAHSTNWLWVNHAQFARLGLRRPDGWADFLGMLDKARAAGLIPLAIGREPWEHTLLFESVAAGMGGAEFYRRAFIDLEPAALDVALLERIFQRISVLRGYLDPAFMTRSWDQATALVRSGRALMQVQGSWVDGEFHRHGLTPGRDYECFRFPDTQGVFLLNADQYVLFKDGPGDEHTRAVFAGMLMQTDLQRDLNFTTGAAPARVDVSREGFNSCGQQAISDLRGANMRRTLMGSIAMGNANPPRVKTAIYQVVSDHLQGRIGDAEAARQLRRAIIQASGEDYLEAP